MPERTKVQQLSLLLSRPKAFSSSPALFPSPSLLSVNSISSPSSQSRSSRYNSLPNPGAHWPPKASTQPPNHHTNHTVPHAGSSPGSLWTCSRAVACPPLAVSHTVTDMMTHGAIYCHTPLGSHNLKQSHVNTQLHVHCYRHCHTHSQILFTHRRTAPHTQGHTHSDTVTHGPIHSHTVHTSFTVTFSNTVTHSPSVPHSLTHCHTRFHSVQTPSHTADPGSHRHRPPHTPAPAPQACPGARTHPGLLTAFSPRVGTSFRTVRGDGEPSALRPGRGLDLGPDGRTHKGAKALGQAVGASRSGCWETESGARRGAARSILGRLAAGAGPTAASCLVLFASSLPRSLTPRLCDPELAPAQPSQAVRPTAPATESSPDPDRPARTAQVQLARVAEASRLGARVGRE